MYKLLIAVSVAFVATFYVGHKIGEAQDERERQRKQAEEKLEHEKKRVEQEREAEPQRGVEREERERKRELETHRKLETQRKQELETHRKLEAQRILDEKITYQRKVQKERIEAEQQQKDRIIDFDNRIRQVIIDRKNRARQWKIDLDHDWHKNQRLVGTRGTAEDQEAFNRTQIRLYKAYGELSAYERETEKLDNLSRELNAAIYKDNWEEANRLYRVSQGFDFTRPSPGVRMEPSRPDLTALENLQVPINRAMRANVLIKAHGGLLKARCLVGSGVIVKISDGEAIILTNRHVVDPYFASARDPRVPSNDKAAKILLDVTLVDQQVVPGQVTWIAPLGVDLALVRIHGPTPEVRKARWKIGRRARVGNQVFAIGNPRGLGWTHTPGAISNFRIEEAGGKDLQIIETLMVLNPGNSGGGLYDEEGYLIGITTWALDKRIDDGLSYAIALDALKWIAPPDLILQGYSEEPD